MHLVNLSLAERRALAQQIHRTKDVNVRKRSQAFMWLSEGLAASQVAQKVGLSRRPISSWVSSYQTRRSNALGSRLPDRPKPGRPPRTSPRVLRALGVWLQESPRRDGYHDTAWTASLFANVLKRADD
jgi:transposase